MRIAAAESDSILPGEKSPFQYFIALLTFTCLGIAGNMMHLPLFFGVDFLFGSIFVLVALDRLNQPLAILVAAIAGIYTFFLWGHFYALIIFCLEAAVVGYLRNRGIRNLIIADIIFWLAVGTPTIWYFYSDIMNVGYTQSMLILLKQPINGVINAIFATFILAALPGKFIRWISLSKELPYMGIRDLMFSLILAAVLIPVLALTIYQNKKSIEQYEISLEEQFAAKYQLIDNYITNHFQELHSLAQIGKIFEESDIRKEELLILAQDKAGFTTLGQETVNSILHLGTTEQIRPGLYRWMPTRNNEPFMLWWKKSYYYFSNPVSTANTYKIYLLQGTDKIINHLHNTHIYTFQLLILVILLGGLTAYLISKKFTRPIEELSAETLDMPSRITSDIPIKWPDTRINEIRELTSNIKLMSKILNEHFTTLRLSKNELEEQVTERTRELKHSMSMMSAIFENSIEGIITIDKDGLIQSYNKAAEKIFCYTADEVTGKNISMLMPEIHARYHNQYLADYRQTGVAKIIGKRREAQAQNKLGNIIPIELSISEIKVDDNILFTGIITDIRERKLAEELKDDFISTVSHELRTPLTAINGAISLLATNVVGELPAEARKMVEITNTNSQRLVRLINDILDIQKMDYGKVDFMLQHEAIVPLVDRVVNELQSYAKGRNIHIHASYAVDLETILMVNPDKLIQVLTNLVSNAIKFSPDNDTISIFVYSEDNLVKISISDNGPGIPEKFSMHIFEKFSQADPKTTRQYGGSGLGLYISRILTEKMNGRISFRNNPDKGATFTLEFPVIK